MIRNKFLVEDPRDDVTSADIDAVSAKFDRVNKDELDSGRWGVGGPELVLDRIRETMEGP